MNPTATPPRVCAREGCTAIVVVFLHPHWPAGYCGPRCALIAEAKAAA